ncbi:hypothetical protein HPB47_010456 [Ixodes persulcatus]|uniref:Uncharacterized protein n=1 Tax=Ixodes persulcatus TaxID=34615 RepID=A0AC60NZC2_IXOPE|nr:hypothetical protein HPB47_010456 [Ixodes persulcatus]
MLVTVTSAPSRSIVVRRGLEHHRWGALGVMLSKTEHNHPVSKATYEQLAKQRALPEEVKGEVQEQVNLKANKKLIKQKIQQVTGHVVLLKDLSNLASSLKPLKKNDLQETVEMVQRLQFPKKIMPSSAYFRLCRTLQALQTLAQRDFPPTLSRYYSKVTQAPSECCSSSSS